MGARLWRIVLSAAGSGRERAGRHDDRVRRDQGRDRGVRPAQAVEVEEHGLRVLNLREGDRHLRIGSHRSARGTCGCISRMIENRVMHSVTMVNSMALQSPEFCVAFL